MSRRAVDVRALCAAILLAVMLPTPGCAWWRGGGEKIVQADAEQILAEALQGRSIAQIALDLGIGAAQVIAALLGSLEPRVQATAAYAEAAKVQAAVLAKAGR